MQRILIIVAAIAASISVGLAAGLGYGHLQLDRQHRAYEKEIHAMNWRIEMLLKRTSRERVARYRAEDRSRALLAQLDKLKKDGGDQAAKIQQLEAYQQSTEAKLKDMTDQAGQLKAARDALNGQLATALETGKKLEAQVALLTTCKKTLETSLAKVNKDLDVCTNDNAGLCKIAHHILNREQSGNALHRVLQNEPLTQIEKVRLEQFTQKYSEKIDGKKVREQ